jgi:hypothetical protein
LAKNGWQLIIKKINMKQLLFLLLFPCLALAQYPGNAGQKITLGEQTSADGLVFRGVANDTNVITPFSDTSAYIILDTVNSKFYHYNRTTTYWALAGGGVSVSSFSAGSTGLTPSTATTGAVTLGGTLAVANGGTNAGEFFPGSVVFAGSSGTYTQDNSGLFYDNANDRLGIGTTSPLTKLNLGTISSQPAMTLGTPSGLLGLTLSGAYGLFAGVINTGNVWMQVGRADGDATAYNLLIQPSGGNVGIGTTTPAVQLHTTGAVRFATFAGGGSSTLTVDNNGDLARTSSIELKKDVTPINYGLNEILQINPINFNWKDEDKYGNKNENGFIAEDVMNVIPNVVGSDAHGLFMDYTKLIPILTKAIQEQNALIKALEQRLLILENK